MCPSNTEGTEKESTLQIERIISKGREWFILVEKDRVRVYCDNVQIARRGNYYSVTIPPKVIKKLRGLGIKKEGKIILELPKV